MLRAISSHQCGSGSNLGVDAICGLNLLLVLSFATRGVSPGTSIFPSPQKPTFLNTNLSRNQIEEEPLKGCVTSKSLFYLFIYLFDIIIIIANAVAVVARLSLLLKSPPLLSRYCIVLVI